MREMKDSGIEWIGEIPKEWNTIILSSLFRERKCKNRGMVENNLLSLSYGNIKKKDITTNEGLLPDSFETYNVINEGNIVFRLTDLQNDKRSLRTGLCKERGIITSAYITLELVQNDDPAYMHYLFHTYDLCKVFYGMGDGVRQGANFEDLKKLKIIRPPLSDQQKISAYLDNKCTKIDSIIEKQEKVIEKLKAYKLSVITEAVTKGLNPDVKMKDSGVEWIGEIPEHWWLPQIKYIATIGSGGTPNRNNLEYWNGSINWFKTGELQNNEIFESEEKITERAVENSSAKLFPVNTILMAMYGQGKTRGMTGLLKSVATTNQACAGITVNNSNVNVMFLWKLLIGAYNAIRENAIGSGQPNLSSTLIGNFRVTIPPLIEQQQIADYLDKKCSAIDKSIEQKQAIIEKLKEYKKSLIYEVVTGKKEVFSDKKAVTVICPVGIPTNEEEYAKILLMQKIITRCGNNLKGRIHLMKIFHALELEIGFSFCSEYTRHFHGPYDNKIDKYESDLVRKGWIKLKKGKNVEYIVVNSTAYKTDYNRIFAEHNKEIERIIDFFKKMKRTSKAEKVATLLASWNDFLIDGIAEPTDDMIITDIRTNWTENKKKIAYATWKEILVQMRKANIVPHGYGKHTIRMED